MQTFLAESVKKSVRLWDVRLFACQLKNGCQSVCVSVEKCQALGCQSVCMSVEKCQALGCHCQSVCMSVDVM